MLLRANLKSVAEAFVIKSGAAHVARGMRRDQAVILAYHNVVPDGDDGRGQRTLHLPVSRFRRHLDRLSETHSIVTVEALLDGSAWNGDTDLPLAAVTFDDAYAGAVAFGVPELVGRGLPATLFVAPGLLGRKAFWWDVLADRREGILPESLMERALEEEAGDRRQILRLGRSGQEWSLDLPETVKSATEEEIADAASNPGITVAAHSWSHLNLVCLPEEVLKHELRRPFRWLDERWGSFLPLISYPYGLSSSRVEMMVLEAGYVAGFRIAGGWLSESLSDTLALPRINVPSGVSIRRYEICTSGLWPLA